MLQYFQKNFKKSHLRVLKNGPPVRIQAVIKNNLEVDTSLAEPQLPDSLKISCRFTNHHIYIPASISIPKTLLKYICYTWA